MACAQKGGAMCAKEGESNTKEYVCAMTTTCTCWSLCAREKNTVPHTQSCREGQAVNEEAQEPLRGEHGRVDSQHGHVRVQSRVISLEERGKHTRIH